MQTIGTYSMVKDEENEDADKYVVKFTASSDFADTDIVKMTEDEKVKTIENVDQLLANVNKALGNNATASVAQPDIAEWDEMMKIPEPTDDDDDDDNNNTTPDKKTDVNLALLFSILSSVLLVAALAVVVVIKIYRRRKNA